MSVTFTNADSNHLSSGTLLNVMHLGESGNTAAANMPSTNFGFANTYDSAAHTITMTQPWTVTVNTQHESVVTVTMPDGVSTMAFTFPTTNECDISAMGISLTR
jgi:hypothetical protein